MNTPTLPPIRWTHPDHDRRGTVAAEVTNPDELPGYAERYGVTYALTEVTSWMPVYRFTGRRDRLTAMIRDNWLADVAWLEDGRSVVEPMDDDEYDRRTAYTPSTECYCAACGETFYVGELGDTRPHVEVCPAR